jgi:hypothetical protein
MASFSHMKLAPILHFGFTLAILFLFASDSLGMRLEPAPVKPLVIDGIKYTAPFDDAYVEKLQARDEKTDKLLWEIVLQRNPEPPPESCGGGIFLKELRSFRNNLIAEDEAERCFMVDLKTKAVTRTVRFRPFRIEDYQAFPKNWDEKTTPVLADRMQSEADWKQYFGAAGVMRKNKPYAPPPETFEKEEILFAAVIADSAKNEAIELEGITLNEKLNTITVSFSCPATTDKKEPTGAKFKNVAGCFVAKAPDAKVIFLHNGKEVSTPAK